MLNLKKLSTKVLTLLKTIDDRTKNSGWIAVTESSLGSNFDLYGSTSCYYRKVGCVVEIYGIVTPHSTITGSDTDYTIFTLPDHYHPALARRYVMQGSGNASWELAVMADGRVCFSRFRNHSINNATGYASATAGTWLPFNATFFVNDYTI